MPGLRIPIAMNLAMLVTALSGCTPEAGSASATSDKASAAMRRPAQDLEWAGDGETTRSDDKHADEPCVVESNGGAYEVLYRATPSPIPLNRSFSLDVTVRDARDGSRDSPDCNLIVDARMPAHYHGMNVRPKVTKVGRGRFKAEGMRFHMPGPWEVYLDISNGPITERAQFDVELE